MSSIVNQSPYLRTSRNFPEDDPQQLSVEINRSYVDIAEKINKRTIGLHPTTRPAINGESWFIQKNQKQQGFRQVYIFTNTATLDVGFKFSKISQFSPKCYGVYTDSSGNWYGLIFAANAAIAGQISFALKVNASPTSDSIVFALGAGAPVLTAGTIVLEWLSDV